MQLPPLNTPIPFRCAGRSGWTLQQSSPWFPIPTSVILLCPRWTQSKWPICWSCCSPTISQYVPSLVFDFLIQPCSHQQGHLFLSRCSQNLTATCYFEIISHSHGFVFLCSEAVHKQQELSIQSPGTMPVLQRNINTQLFNQNAAIAR